MHPVLQKTALKDTNYLVGFICFLLSLFLFQAHHWLPLQTGDFFSGLFFVHYGLFVAYLIYTILAKRKVPKTEKARRFSYNILLLLLANISCYALNRDITVFHESTTWLTVYLVMLNGALLWLSLKPNYQANYRHFLLAAIFSSGLLFNLYETLYTIPFYPIGLAAFWFFGISLHVFVPLWYAIQLSYIVRRYLQTNRVFKYAILGGAAVPLVLIMLFSIRWVQINQQIDRAYAEREHPLQPTDLPVWVSLGQQLPANWVTERVLKTGILYTQANLGDWSMWPTDGMRVNAAMTHDPLIVIASTFSGPMELDFNERVKLLRAVFNQRHQTTERLRSGDDLSTGTILTNVELFPDYRLAYTEKTFTIINNGGRSWPIQQEAIYTFYLPEGSVVTSASLWIEDQEMPALLTTKSKADTAYRTIVGVERRDPLLIHWQEGNLLSVRVFPCTPAAPRKFKIGVTTPLQLQAGQLVYKNIDFKGPDWATAEENIHLAFTGAHPEVTSDLRFAQDQQLYHYTGNYRQDWEVRFPAASLSESAFGFRDEAYRVSHYEVPSVAFAPTNIYLDINAGWTKSSFAACWELVKDRNVFVYNGGWQQLTEQNHRALFKELRNLNFTLFPFHKLPAVDQALVITQYSGLTPVLEDLDNTAFAQAADAFYATQQQPCRVFNLSDQWSPYLQSLRSFQTICGQQGAIEQLAQHLTQQQFPACEHTGEQVILPNAQMAIRKVDATTGSAPDHLMRLFVYHQLMNRIGEQYFSRKALEDTLIADAQLAHVLSPVSSLVVLESQADYDRFDIKDSQDALKNATFSEAGAVPEPHEWLLILLCMMTAGWLWYRQRAVVR